MLASQDEILRQQKMTMDRPSENRRLFRLCESLGYEFKNLDVLGEAFRHSSYVNELGGPNLQDNERLEFLGDAVLDLAISHILMEMFEEARGGTVQVPGLRGQ